MSNTKVFAPNKPPEPEPAFTSTGLWLVVSAPCFLAFAAIAITFPFWYMPLTIAFLRTYLSSPDGSITSVVIFLLIGCAAIGVGCDIGRMTLPSIRSQYGPEKKGTLVPRFFGIALASGMLLSAPLTANRAYEAIPELNLYEAKGVHFSSDRLSSLKQKLESFDQTHDVKPIEYLIHKPTGPRMLN